MGCTAWVGRRGAWREASGGIPHNTCAGAQPSPGRAHQKLTVTVVASGTDVSRLMVQPWVLAIRAAE